MSRETGPDAPLTSEGLVRGLGRWDATFLTVGSVVGTGIFITTADIARVLPHQGMVLLVWTLAGFLTLAGALTYAELGAMFPRAGGMYHFLKEAYGPFWGFLFGWACFLIIMSGGIAALAVAFGEYLGSFAPFFSTANILFSTPLGPWTWTVSGGQIAAALAILLLTAVNYIGLREGAGVQNFLTVFRIGAVVVFVALAFLVEARAPVSLLAPLPSVPLLAGVGIAMIAALWTYDGWYGPTFSAGEMRDPQRTLPFGLVWGTVIVMALYAMINLVYLRALSLDEMAATRRIAETAAAALFGAGGARTISFAVLVSTSAACRRPSSTARASTCRWRATACSSAAWPRSTRATTRPAGACGRRACGAWCWRSPGPTSSSTPTSSSPCCSSTSPPPAR